MSAESKDGVVAESSPTVGKQVSGGGGKTGGAHAGVSTNGGDVGSPYDLPTGQFTPVGPGGKPLPRTEEELGLEPDLADSEVRATVPSGPGPQGGSSAADPRGADEPGGELSPSGNGPYSYASIPPASNPPNGTVRLRRNGDHRRGTLDFGLFLLRVILGATFLYHGLQKLTGWFHGPGLDGTRDMMEQGGWDRPSLATALLTAGEVGGGVLLVLGLATPLAAGAVLAVILDAWAWKQGMHPGLQYKAGPGAVEYESVLAGIATVVILTGPGRWSLDRGRSWATRPGIGSFVVLVLAIAAAVATWWYLHGGNPFVGIGPVD
ncbi:DoxX family protein [Nocardia paucivorans]|uniref:DoxX family protein n=1 Tax=Nocardia paucivorans TaxID=114259 RepID=UPI001FDFE4C4|nr:DoxX family protein [Nocardia paucivorans]